MKYKAITIGREASESLGSGSRNRLSFTWHTVYRGEIILCVPVTERTRPHARLIAELVEVRPIFGGRAYSYEFSNIRRLIPFAVEEGQLLYEIECEPEEAEGEDMRVEEAIKGLRWRSLRDRRKKKANADG